MFSIYLYSIGSVIVVSLVSLIGIFFIALKEDVLKRYLFLLISLAVGALLGDAFIHLIPEAFKSIPNTTYLAVIIIAGILVFFVLEKALHWHHHHHHHGKVEGVSAIHPVGRMILVSDAVHNFIDGLIIGASYLVSIEVGMATTVAIIFHEIPHEIGDFGVLIHSGYKKAKALWLNFMTAMVAVLGTIIALVMGNVSEISTVWLVPLAAGGFIYIALSDLIPEMQKVKRARDSILQLIAIMIGVSAMILLLMIE